jgi:chemotaxis protein MotB
MAEEAADGGGGGDGGAPPGPPPKCPECPPGLPAWMATFSDLVTLLLTFFVLLLSFAKTETNKYEAALGSIRSAFGGNVYKHGEVVMRGKSPDNAMTMIDSADPIRPFPIEFLTMEGLLEKKEINRESTEVLVDMQAALAQNSLSDDVDIFETKEGVKVKMKDRIYYEKNSLTPSKLDRASIDRMIKMVLNEGWSVFVEAHASRGETIKQGGKTFDAFSLSSFRAADAARFLIERGVLPSKITTVFYGDTRPDKPYDNSINGPVQNDRRVEFVLRKVDLKTEGHKVPSV